MNPQRGKPQHQGALKGHYKDGRIFRPPLLAFSETRKLDWVRDDLPDLLWPAALIALDGDAGGIKFGRLQQAVFSKLVKPGQGLETVAIDGRLTSLEAVPAASRRAQLPILQRVMADLDVLPLPLLAALRLYPDIPGAWLLVDPWSNLDPGLSREDALDFLARLIVSLVSDEHMQALLNFVPLAWRVIRGRITMEPHMVDILKSYPGDSASRALADSAIRASFASFQSADYAQNPGLKERRVMWAASFWRRNGSLSPCFPEETHRKDTEIHEGSMDVTAKSSDELGGILSADDPDAELVRELVSATAAHFNRILEHSLAPPADIDLYRPTCHEVISGLVARATRAVIATLRAPQHWSGEHGSTLTRLLAETEILLTWLAAKGPDLYEKYQGYGMGKSKLMKNHMNNLAMTFSGSPPSDLVEAVAHFEKRLGGTRGESFVEVSMDSTFAGITTRQMAIEVGLKDLYDRVYQSTSGVIHGEWWAIEDYVMQRCLNPLHRFHLIPSLDPVFPTNANLGRFWVRRIDDIVNLAISHLDAGLRKRETTGEDRCQESGE